MQSARCNLVLYPYIIVRIGAVLLISTALVFGCATNKQVADSRVQRDVFRPEEIGGRAIFADELRLYRRDGEVARFLKIGDTSVRLISQDRAFLVDYGIYTPLELMISQSDVIRIEVERVVYRDPPAAVRDPGRNAVYVQLATILVSNSFTLHYERIIAENVSLSIGAGYGCLNYREFMGPSHKGQLYGAEALVHFFFGRSYKLEIAIGASLFTGNRVNTWTSWGAEAADDIGGTLATFVGYRYQPNAGFFFKAGFAWSMVYGIPFAIGLGAVF